MSESVTPRGVKYGTRGERRTDGLFLKAEKRKSVKRPESLLNNQSVCIPHLFIYIYMTIDRTLSILI
jgi:hypothetical protein